MAGRKRAAWARGPTSADVAARAGVSRLTVSWVLNGKTAGKVSAATREKVLRAVEELGYRRNATALNLRLGRTLTIAFVTPRRVTGAWVAHQLLGAQRAAEARHHALLLVGVGPDRRWEEAVREALGGARADLAVLDGGLGLRGVDLRALAGRVAVVNDLCAEAPSVNIDAVGGITALMEHLLALGHRRIAYLSPAVHLGTREGAYRRALARAGLADEPRHLALAGPSLAEAEAAARRLLDQGERPTAVLCGDEVLAAGAYGAARALGLRIPDDLSVAAYHGFTIAEVLAPPLTALGWPAEEMGAMAVELLLTAAERDGPPPAVLIPAEPVVRGSTAPPGHARPGTVW